MRRLLRLLSTGAGEAAYNMAVDEVLLAGAAGRPTLRLYAWEPAAVSLGYFQPLERRGERPLVRRLTGGGAIVHRDELTYSVAAPLDFFEASGLRLQASGGVKESFHAIHRAVARGLGCLGIRIDGGEPTSNLKPEGRSLKPADEPFLCFERRSPTDLRVGGRKLVGSAQRREGRAVLQHGSLPLGSEVKDGARFTVSEAAGRRVTYDEVARALAEGFREALDVDLEPRGLGPDEQEAALRLARERYGAESWTARR
jgi:lipoate-protein ligase A